MEDTTLIYVDSSVLVRAYLADEPGHAAARALLEEEKLLVTATFSVVEVTSMLVRARRLKRLADIDVLIEKLHEEVSPDGPVNLTRPDLAATESAALTILRHYALDTSSAMHLAAADLAARPLAEPGEQIGFATYREPQRRAAEALGFAPIV